VLLPTDNVGRATMKAWNSKVNIVDPGTRFSWPTSIPGFRYSEYAYTTRTRNAAGTACPYRVTDGGEYLVDCSGKTPRRRRSGHFLGLQQSFSDRRAASLRICAPIISPLHSRLEFADFETQGQLFHDGCHPCIQGAGDRWDVTAYVNI